MAYSSVRYTSTGDQTYNVPFPYLEAAHVKVYINGVETSAFTWSDAATIHLNVAPAVGATILIKRETPRDGMDYTFSAQPRLKGDDLDDALKQTYYVGLEALDQADSAILDAAVSDAQAAQAAAEGARDIALVAQGAAVVAQGLAKYAADLAATYANNAGAGTYAEVSSAPTTDANEVKLYAKDVTGVAELFIRKESNGAEIQVTSGGILNGTPPDASEGTKGIAELATQAEVNAGTDDARIVTPKKLYATPGIYRKNAIINGDMRIVQRGTSFPTAASGQFVVDRFAFVNACDAVVTLSQSTDVPSGEGFQFSAKVDVTTADASIAAGQYAFLTHRIEGYDFFPLVGKTCTLSFWVKSPKTGTHCVAFNSSTADRCYIATYTVSAANTWEKKTVTLTFNYSGGTWNYTNGLGLSINFMLNTGSTYHGTAGSWLSAVALSTSGQVNCLDNTANDFYLTGVQFERGEAVTRFEHRPFGQELALCQRYYEKSYNYAIAPGAASSDGCVLELGPRNSSGTTYGAKFAVEKRAVPTVTCFSDNDGASGYCYNNGNKACAAGRIGTAGFSYASITSGDSTNNASYHWVASIEL